MKVKYLIEILNQCDGDLSVGTFANNHWNDSSHYRSHGDISVCERDGDIIIGNFGSRRPGQFWERVVFVIGKEDINLFY